jgi:hypothetical protein
MIILLQTVTGTVFYPSAPAQIMDQLIAQELHLIERLPQLLQTLRLLIDVL